MGLIYNIEFIIVGLIYRFFIYYIVFNLWVENSVKDRKFLGFNDENLF